MSYEPAEDHYESIDNLPPHERPNDSGHVAYYGYHKGIDPKFNFNYYLLLWFYFVSDFDYEDPTPLIESYQMDNIEYVGDHQYQIIGKYSIVYFPF